MKPQEYLAQSEYYFSESSRQLVPLKEMPFTYANNCFQKLLREHGEDFSDTPLYNAFIEILDPKVEELTKVFTQHGAASCIILPGMTKVKARNKLKKAAGNKKLRFEEKNGAISAVVEVDLNVKVKGKTVSR